MRRVPKAARKPSGGRTRPRAGKKRTGARADVRDLLLLQRVTQRITSILDLETLLEQVVDDVARTFGYTRSGILLVDEAAGDLVIAAVRGWTVNYHIKGDRFRIGEYGMVGRVAATGETLYAPDVSKNPDYEVSEVSTRSEIDIPLKIHGTVIGVFNAQSPRRNAFSASRRRLLESLAGHIATAIENARLFEREREQRSRMAAELDQARLIQTSLFPSGGLKIGPFEVTGTCLPCTEVGGDWFDHIPLTDGRAAVVVGDVSGKGMGAALLMSSTRSIIRFLAEQLLPPAEVLSRANAALLRDLPKPNFVTVAIAILDPAHGSITVASAGHPWPLMVTDRPQFVHADAGFPLGLLESQYSEHTFPLPPGGSLLLYSDGITEAEHEGDQYGARRLLDLAGKAGWGIEKVLDDVRAFTKDASLADDRTVVMIRAV